MDDEEWLNLSLEDLMGDSRKAQSGFFGYLLLESNKDISEDVPYYDLGIEVLEAMDFIPEPIPYEEFSRTDKERYGDLLRQHQAHLILSLWPDKCDIWDAGYRYLKRLEEEVRCYHAKLVYTAGRIISAEEFLTENRKEIPMHNWVSFFCVSTNDGTDAYTIGLEDFGGNELEIHDSEKDATELLALLEELVLEMLKKRRRYQAEQTVHDKNGNVYCMKRIDSRYFEGHSLLLKQNS